jgi:hypothetical protein
MLRLRLRLLQSNSCLSNVMRVFLAVLALFFANALMAANKSELAGLYGNVRLSPQTGDLGGQEIRFFTDQKTGKPMVEFVDCEGWCNKTYTVPLMQDAAGYWFAYTENLYDGEGGVSKGDTRTYRLKRKGKAVILTGAYSSCSDCWTLGPHKLKPLKKSFGIAVANNEP